MAVISLVYYLPALTVCPELIRKLLAALCSTKCEPPILTSAGGDYQAESVAESMKADDDAAAAALSFWSERCAGD